MYRRSWKDKLRDLVMIGGAISVVLVLMFFFNRGKSSDAPMASAGMVENDGPQETVELLPKVKKRPDRHRVHTWKPEKTFNGFTVYPLSGTEEVLLIKMDGEVVHRWNLDVERARLLPNCNLLVIHGSKWGKKQPKWNTLRRYLREYDWEGRVVWEYTADEVVHHDAHKLDNGNYLFLKRTTLPYPESWLPKGRDPEKFSVRSDSVVEITADGKLVWDWHFHDAFDLAECGWRGCKRDRFSKPGQVVPDRNFIDWSHANTSSVIPPNRWHDAGDKRFTPGNILVLPRSFWTMYLVDRESKEIVWSYHGNPSDENPGDGLIRGHESYMIPKGLPGAGNILVFDNGISKVRSYSRVLEVNPTTKEIVWKYEAPGEFFTDGGGVAQRLPNGNTLVSEDKDARVFEVTQSGEVVWDIRGKYRVTRARRYPSGYCKHLQEEESK